MCVFVETLFDYT